jgi:hypothetical protein
MTGVKQKNGIVRGRLLPEFVEKAANVCRRSLAVVKFPDFIDIVIPGKDLFQFPGVLDGIAQGTPFLIPVYGDEYRPLLPHHGVISQNIFGGYGKPPVLGRDGKRGGKEKKECKKYA